MTFWPEPKPLSSRLDSSVEIFSSLIFLWQVLMSWFLLKSWPTLQIKHAFVDKIARLLRPGGYLMLATQNRFTLKRWSEVVPQGVGQIRKWVDARTLRRLLASDFDVVELTSIVPVGDRGILRLINSVKVNKLLSVFASRFAHRSAERAFLPGAHLDGVGPQVRSLVDVTMLDCLQSAAGAAEKIGRSLAVDAGDVSDLSKHHWRRCTSNT